jgi:hypothetical protein
MNSSKLNSISKRIIKQLNESVDKRKLPTLRSRSVLEVERLAVVVECLQAMMQSISE